MRARDWARLATLLARIAKAAKGRGPLPEVSEKLDQTTSSGATFDIYQHRHHSTKCVLALHGVTIHGKRDRRLVAFARSLAQSKITCIVPHLEDLAKGRWDTADLTRLEEIISTFWVMTKKPLGIIGFSFGSSYGLVTAAHPAFAKHIEFIVAIGAYYSLGDLFEMYIELENRPPASADEWNEFIYLPLVLACQNPHLLPDAKALPDLRSLLSRYCYAATLEEKHHNYETHLRSLHLIQTCSKTLNPDVLCALSPQGKLDGLRCSVGLMHDKHDLMVPPSHSEQILNELQHSPRKNPPQLLISTMLSHVSVTNMFKFAEFGKLFKILSPLVRDI